MKKGLSFLLTLMIGGMFVFWAPAAQAASEPSIARVEYDGGKVEVDFIGRVLYSDVKVTAEDSEGKVYRTKLLDWDDDDLDFRIIEAEGGKTYHFTISGIKSAGATGFTSVSGTVELPSIDKVTVREIEYDAGDRELSVDFAHRVSYKGVKVSLKDSAGKSCSVRIVEKDSDDMELRVSALQRGAQYTLTISGIKHRDATAYTSVTQTFTA